MPATARTSLVEDVYEGLAQQILSAEPTQDEAWLPKTAELSEQYGVSRTVVREAINRLESQGLIETRHGVGPASRTSVAQARHGIAVAAAARPCRALAAGHRDPVSARSRDRPSGRDPHD